MNTLGNRPLARSLARIQPFWVMDILAQAKQMEAQGIDVIHLEVGEPDFNTPEPIKQAGLQAIQNNQTHYTAAEGLPELRQAISQYYQDRFSIYIEPERILITPGASGALQLILSVLLNPGDQVLMPDPGYPCNRHMVQLLGAEPIGIGVKAKQSFILDNDQILRHWSKKTRALMVASPANPTGQVLSSARLSAYYEAVKAPGGILIVDEIYQGLQYEGQPHTALQIGRDHLFVVNSFSKFFGMSGWRLGWLVAPRDYMPALTRLAQNLFLAPPTIAQYAALAAFQPETLKLLEYRREILQQRRDYLYDILIDLGFKIAHKPQGAFYIYADISKFSADSFVFCRELLQKTGVAITPGQDFGLYRADKFVRFAYTTEVERLKTAMLRLAEFVRRS